ncbi:MAG: CpaF family protein [Lachnospiraceae bacterium]|nr:CpaF family protein [Lachnospiraceae bacterium]
MNLDKEMIREQVLQSIDMTREADEQELHEIIDRVIEREVEYKYITIEQRIRIHQDIFNSIRGLGVIEDLLEDENVTEIMINGKDHIFIEKEGRIERYSGCVGSDQRLHDIIQQIVGNTNRRVNESNPIADARLSDGSRVNVVLPPIALDGAVITIRKFAKEQITIEQLIKWKSITVEAADFLKKLVVSGYNIFVSGGTGSGKTTFLNVLSNFISADERVVTIEDSAELQLKNIKNIVRLETRQANSQGENEITIRDLIKTSLRMRPDRIIVGEVRGHEVLDMLQAMNSGHDGSLSTGHARLETMALMGMEIPLNAVRAQIASGIDIIVHLSRMPDKSRKVVEVNEVQGYVNNEIQMNKIYELQSEGLIKTGRLQNTKKLKDYGMDVGDM